MRLGATVTTWKQNKHQANGKLLILQNQRRPDRFNQMLRSCWLVFFNANGIVHKEFVPPGQTVNQQFYLEVLKRLRDSVREKRPEMWSSGDWFLHHDNATAHTALSEQQFLAKNNMTVIPHPPYSPDLAPCDFFLFPHMKCQMKGKCFADVSEVEKKMLEVLNISTEEFQKCFQQWEKCWYKCSESKGAYFDGDYSCNSTKPNKPFKKLNPVIFGSPLVYPVSL